jgi:hypothetical protein
VINVVGNPEAVKGEAVPVAVSRVSPVESEALGRARRVPVSVAVRAEPGRGERELEESELEPELESELELDLDVELEKKTPPGVPSGVGRDAGDAEVSVAAVSVVVIPAEEIRGMRPDVAAAVAASEDRGTRLDTESAVVAAPTAAAGIIPKEAIDAVVEVADISTTDDTDVERGSRLDKMASEDVVEPDSVVVDSAADVLLSNVLVATEVSSVVDVADSTAVLDWSNSLVSSDLASGVTQLTYLRPSTWKR